MKVKTLDDLSLSKGELLSQIQKGLAHRLHTFNGFKVSTKGFSLSLEESNLLLHKWSKSANAQRLFLRSKRHFSRVWKVYFLCNVTVLAPILQGAHVMDFHLITFLWPGTFQDKSIQRSKKERTPNEKAFTRFCVPSYSAWELPMTGQRVILHSDLAPAPWNGVFDVSKVWSVQLLRCVEQSKSKHIPSLPITALGVVLCFSEDLFLDPVWQVVKPKVAARETKI